jgi:hypothetical protein
MRFTNLSYIVIMICALPSFTWSRPSPVCLVPPLLDTSTIGFSLNREEQGEMVEYIIQKTRLILNRKIEPITNQSIEQCRTMKRGIAFLTINEFYFEYMGSGARTGHIRMTLCLFDSTNGYGLATLQLCAEAVGASYYGENNPFENAFSAAANKMMYRLATLRMEKKTAPGNVTLDEMVRGRPLSQPAADEIVVLMPELNEQTIGYRPLQKEIFNLSHFLAYKIGSLVGKQARLVTLPEMQTLSENAYLFAKISPQLIDWKQGLFCLELCGYKPGDLNKPLFKQCSREMASDDWNENHIFCQAITMAFKQFESEYKNTIRKLCKEYADDL